MYDIIEAVASKLYLPTVWIKDANKMFEENGSLFLNRPHNVVKVGCLYMVSRCNGSTRTLNDFQTASNIRKSTISKIYRELFDTGKYQPKVMDELAYVDMVANKLNLPPSVLIIIRKLFLNERDKYTRISSQPIISVGGMAYVIANENGVKISYDQVADVCGCTPFSIRNASTSFKEKRNV